MTKEFVLKFLGNIGEVDISTNKISTKVEALQSSNTEYELYICRLGTSRILACKLSLCEEFSYIDESTRSDEKRKTQSPLQVKLWKTIHLPFCICDFSLSCDELWIIGEESYSNIKPYIEDTLKFEPLKEKPVEDHFMDVDNSDFILQEYEFTVELPTDLKHNIKTEKFSLKCEFYDESIIIGSKNLSKESWEFALVTSKYEPLLQTELSAVTPLPSINFTYKRTHGSCEEQLKPFIRPTLIIYPTEEVKASRNNVLYLLLNINGSKASNCAGFIGHPEGKVFYFSGSLKGETKCFIKNNPELEIYDMKQPIVGIHIIKDVGGIKGTTLLIIGSLGKVACISGKSIALRQKSLEIVLSESVTLHATTFQLPSSLQHHAICKGNMFYLSPEGKLCLSQFSKTRGKTDGKENLLFSKNSVLMERVADFAVLNENFGLFLLVTKTGCLHLSKVIEKKNNEEASISLPSLMNEAMHLSSDLTKLSILKSYQTLLFEAVSTFASIKFSGFSNLKVKCMLSEIKNNSSKFLLMIDIKGLDEFEMKSGYWFITASVHSCLETKCAVITKIVPLDPECTNISVEVEESILSSSVSSSLPLLVELGLILTLPKEMEPLNCFRLIKKKLPLFVKIKELLLNEFYLMQIQPYRHKKRRTSNPLFKDYDNLHADIIALCQRHTYVKLLHSVHRVPMPLRSTSFPTNVQFCMLQSTADSILKLDLNDAVLPFRILQIILQKSLSEKTTDMLNVKCKDDKMASIHLSSINNSVTFSINTDTFDLLMKLRMAMTSTLIMLQWVTENADSHSLGMSAKLSRDCEELSKELLAMYGQDVNEEDFIQKVLIKYQALRNISSRLIFC